MTVTESLTGRPLTLSETATGAASSSRARRRSSSELPWSECSSIIGLAFSHPLNNYIHRRRYSRSQAPRAKMADTLQPNEAAVQALRAVLRGPRHEAWQEHLQVA